VSIWRQLTHGLRSLVRRETADQEIRDEVAEFLDEAAAELVSRGMPVEDAKRAVRLKYGTAQGAREDVRSFGWEATVTSVLTDLRYGMRLLRRTPGFTTVAVLTLGLGIGSATAIYSAVRPVLFEPLPYPYPDQILSITDRNEDGAPLPVTFGTYRELVERSRSFQALSAFKPWQPVATGQGEPERLEGQRVSAAFFEVLGVTPALGRGFDSTDDRPGGPDVVILSHGLWRRLFGGDSTIIGRHMQLDGAAFRVLGIMPPEFEHLPRHPAHAWALLQYDASLPSFDGREWGHHLDVVGRVQAGIDADAAGFDLHGIAADPIPERPRPAWASMDQGIFVRPLRDAESATARPLLIALLGAVTLLLVIACVNVTNLLLTRGVRRRGEMAVRAALGAASPRLLRQLVTEGLLLAALGGTVGLAFAWFGVGALVSLSPPELPRVESITLNAAAFAFAAGVTGFVGIIAGAVPVVVIVTGGNLRRGLLRASRRTTGGHMAARGALVVAQVGLASVLLAGAGLLLRSMQRLSDVSAGLDPSDMVVMQVQWAAHGSDANAVHRFYTQSLAAVRELPGVVSAALTSQLPLSGDLDMYSVQSEDDAQLESGAPAYRYAVSPDYFATMRIPIVRGRSLPLTANPASPSVVVSESLARIAFDGRDPIGQRVHVGRPDLPAYTVVGVVGDVKQASLDAEAAEAAYVIPGEWYFADAARWLVVRTEGNAAMLIPFIKQAIWSVDSDQPVVRIATMEDLVVRSESQRRFALIALEAFALMAMVLAAIGLYGVVAGSVNERWHEIGVRSALGASRRRLLAHVIRQGMILTAVGILIGLAAAAIASETMVTLLFGVSRVDPVTYVGVALLLMAATGVATWIPAGRAAAIDPAHTLRAE